MSNILLVEDDVRLRGALTRILSGNHQVRAVGDAATAVNAVARGPVDLVVLDLGLPDMDGSTVLRLIRASSDLPVIVASARGDETSIIRLLEAGADDYLVKPFSQRHLMARINALLRRCRQRQVNVYEVGELRVYLANRQITLRGSVVHTSRREFEILAYLAQHAGAVVPKTLLADHLAQSSNAENTPSLDMNLLSLRRKLGESVAKPRYLHSVRGVGIKLVSPQYRD